jgi:hypothetical protein
LREDPEETQHFIANILIDFKKWRLHSYYGGLGVISASPRNIELRYSGKSAQKSYY